MLPFWTKTPGVSGKIKEPENFVVKEMLPKKFFTKYKTSGIVQKKEGKYNLFLLKKRNMTTHSALEKIRKKFRVEKIGFAGLKDKHAVTEQYLTMKNGNEFKENGIELIKVGTTDSFLSKGELIGNEFEIMLHHCDKIENLPKIIREINKKGLPNYFGPQRFGIHGNNHIIGRLIVKRKFRKALDLINKAYNKNYKNVRDVNKERLKFFVNAYQSWLFNQLLADYVKKGKYFSGFLPVIGYNTKNTGKAATIIKKEDIKPSDFMINELRLACSGGKRKAFIKTYINYTFSGNNALLSFMLPAGSYATVVLREVTKDAFND